MTASDHEPRDLAAVVPSSGAVEWVVIQNDLQRQAFGIDLASGAWYRAAYHNVTGWLPGEGILSGRALPGGVVTTKGVEKRDNMVDQIACPTVYLRRTLNDTTRSNGWSISELDQGWLLTVPVNREGAVAPLAYEFAIGVDGRVATKRRSDEAQGQLLRTFEESPKGFQLSYPAGGQETVTDVRFFPQGKTWTVRDIERLAINQRREESAARTPKDEKPEVTLQPGEAEPSAAVRLDTGARVGPALVLSGILIVALAAFVWWRNRS
jgi:hypothetical protein